MKSLPACFVFLFAFGLIPFSMSGAEAEAAAPPQVFLLEAAETQLGPWIGIDIEGQDFAFRKEPVYADGAVIRASLDMGDGDRIGFAFDRHGKRLYVDANRNLDLTDDPETRHESLRDDGQSFRFHVSRGEGSSRMDYIVCLYLYRFGGNCAVLSAWRGDVELNGRKYRIEVADDMDGVFQGGRHGDVLAIGSADQSEDEDWSPFGCDFPRDGSVSLDGHVYRFVFAPKNGVVEAVVTEIFPPMGELRIEGGPILRLVLEGTGRAILDRPGPVNRVPAGVYRRRIVVIDDPARAAGYGISGPIRVRENASTVLKAGGPFQGVPRVGRCLQFLQLDYELLGAGGEAYNPGTGSFRIALNGKQIRDGRFEPG